MVAAITGFCWVDVKLPGPFHVQLTPGVEVLAVSASNEPAQMGVLVAATGFTGTMPTVTLTVSFDAQPPAMAETI